MNEGNFQIQFTFIDGLNSHEQRKKSRSHVTAQHYRRRRYDARQSRDEQRKEKEKPLRKRDHEGENSSRCVPGENQLSLLRTDACVGGNRGIAAGYGYDNRRCAVTLMESPSLGAGRIDPFACYPVQATHEVDELVDHYCYVIPSLVHKHWLRAIRRPRSAWDLFCLYHKDRPSFLGMLHHTAHHLASMRRFGQTIQTIKLKQQALHAVNLKLSVLEGPYDDGTIVAVGLLANGERLWGSRETARMHWAALKRMLIKRGGFPNLKRNPVMHTKLLWSFIALSWPTSDEVSPSIDGFCESAAGVKEMAGASPSSSFRMSCDEFTQFMAQRKEQCLMRKTAILRCVSPQSSSALVSDRMWAALVPKETGYSHPDKRQAFENCRMACLIFLNLVVSDHGEESQTTRRYFADLATAIQDEDDDSAMTAEHFLWTLLSAVIPGDHYERCWKLSRMVGIVKKAGVAAWAEIEALLRLFLGWAGPACDARGLLRAWNGRVFAEEVMNEPQELIVDHICSIGCRICR